MHFLTGIIITAKPVINILMKAVKQSLYYTQKLLILHMTAFIIIPLEKTSSNKTKSNKNRKSPSGWIKNETTTNSSHYKPIHFNQNYKITPKSTLEIINQSIIHTCNKRQKINNCKASNLLYEGHYKTKLIKKQDLHTQKNLDKLTAIPQNKSSRGKASISTLIQRKRHVAYLSIITNSPIFPHRQILYRIIFLTTSSPTHHPHLSWFG